MVILLIPCGPNRKYTLPEINLLAGKRPASIEKRRSLCHMIEVSSMPLSRDSEDCGLNLADKIAHLVHNHRCCSVRATDNSLLCGRSFLLFKQTQRRRNQAMLFPFRPTSTWFQPTVHITWVGSSALHSVPIF